MWSHFYADREGMVDYVTMYHCSPYSKIQLMVSYYLILMQLTLLVICSLLNMQAVTVFLCTVLILS